MTISRISRTSWHGNRSPWATYSTHTLSAPNLQTAASDGFEAEFPSEFVPQRLKQRSVLDTHAAVTKVPHLACKVDLLGTPEQCHILNCRIEPRLRLVILSVEVAHSRPKAGDQVSDPLSPAVLLPLPAPGSEVHHDASYDGGK